ncbi:hypothetical protein Kpol_1002p9 [Vanderwaltozyma polyspora DSM 70294]|uniref:Formate/nitrite transporter n=1 Tax=Vanderwaltozyma polyspora (strain ATCC 22028 / DSM 70294 / BCRC 21397 / CBS 2163 / NBRC 10782 / NRRL Y-8283 / UCD 57-17) TaxID=436907 RepID=A7TE42_VANPO|nr:uncharacterized protein Kpol_1002p9 [Vanderwaltozyma polyspora DSM 70294]EDO19364.1 hypothetical protein Kpol_1002p9 [Vanderwaltozyma polyspora DSM 70294]
MAGDDSLYSSPHEAALAVVATAMKKSRLRIDTLILNSIIGGILFSSGGFLYVGFHAENPDLVANNPGVANFVGAFFFGIGLFYVVIMGADLFNSNILFFSVGLLRGAISIYDLTLSWFVSWIGNIAGNLFVAYLFMYLSGAGTSKLWSEGSRKILEDKASFSFIQTFLKGIAGNFYVCLAVYLQLMAKPIHVRYLIMTLPIFTFVSLGFTHVVADMTIAYIGLLNGADLSVGKYIWKLLISASVGNIIGGSAFGLFIPYYLHLVVVEADQKRLAMPQYEARDEQPDLNTDSRVVKVMPIEEDDIDDEMEEDTPDAYSSSANNDIHQYTEAERRHSLDEKNNLSLSRMSTARSGESRRTYKSLHTVRSNISRFHDLPRSPPGVFPILGMGKPLQKGEKIGSGGHNILRLVRSNTTTSHKPGNIDIDDGEIDATRAKTIAAKEVKEFHNSAAYNVNDDKAGSVMERAINRFINLVGGSEQDLKLPVTTQDAMPHNKVDQARAYGTTTSIRSPISDTFSIPSIKSDNTMGTADVD